VLSRPIPRTALRLGGALAVVLVLFATALLVTRFSLSKLAEAEAEVSRLDEAKHAGHLASAFVREAYIQQTQTIIERDASNLALYEAAAATTRQWLERLRSHARTEDDGARVEAMVRLADENDRVFRSQLLEAIAQGDDATRRAVHAALAEHVTHFAHLNHELNATFEQRSATARADAQRRRRNAGLAITACFVLAAIASLVLGLSVVRSILRPLGALRAGALQVAQGDLDHHISVSGHDEFAELAQTFNRMTDDLRGHQDQLIRSQKLASIGQIAAGVAHELNNPLGVIVGYVKLLERELGRDREELQIIRDELEQCQRIVGGMLDLTRPNRLEPRPVELVDLVRDVVDRLSESKVPHVVPIEVDAPDPDLTVTTDERRLRQVLTNILRNAIEASPVGKTVAVSVTRPGDDVAIVVRDAGPGIPADIRERVFEPFFTTKDNGTGLGLAISQTIVTALGGRIELSAAAGGGTEAAIRLPAHSDRLAMEERT